MSFLTRLLFQVRRPKIIIVVGRGQKVAADAIAHVLGQYSAVRNVAHQVRSRDVLSDVLVFPFLSISHGKDIRFFLETAKTVLIVGTHTGELRENEHSITGNVTEVEDVARALLSSPAKSRIILNFDDDAVRGLAEKMKGVEVREIFGFGEGASLRVTDVFITEAPSPGTNFKIHHKGKIVPVWLSGLFGKEYIYAALAAAAVGIVFDLHLVQVSQALASWRGR